MSLTEYIQSIIPISEQKLSQITRQYEYAEVEKNEFILKEGQISQYSYFLAEGIARSYIIDLENEEITINLYAAPCFVNDVLSLFKQQPTAEFIQALTPCNFWRISYENLQNNFHGIPEFREFGRMMLVMGYTSLKNRTISLAKDTAETRYLNLMKNKPEIFQHVPLKIIASFLGITDTSLSRIRKEIIGKV